ncbi:5647_t:CDS:1, partial [Entrophospora sp. SA101]
LRKKLLATIGYTGQESIGPRSKPSFEKESQRFRVELRKKDFLNPFYLILFLRV